MNELTFIKGKGIITKSIDDLVISGWFECSIQLYEQLHKLIDKVLTLSISFNGNTIDLNCNISTDTKSYLSFVEDHGCVRLDIHLPDVLLVGYILKGKINLIVNK